MISEHRYILEKGSKKYLCPDCNKKTFVRYIDTYTGDHLPEQYGRCDREINCAYHLNPYNNGYAKMMSEQEQSNYSGSWKPAKPTPQPKPVPRPVSFIPLELLKQSRTGYHQNNFVQWLSTMFETNIKNELISRYHIGTSKYWNGATVFWQIDQQGRIRSGKIMLYNPTTGKRVKEPFNYITWVHKVTEQPEFELKQCFFGEHLLKLNPGNPVAIVESEKTAIVASVYFPQYIWLAIGSLTNLNAEKCSVLKGRTVTLFPDLNGFEKWSSKANELSYIVNFTVSDLLEHKATNAEKKQGLDLADYLIRFDWQIFREAQTLVQEITHPEVSQEPRTVISLENDENEIIKIQSYSLSETLTKLNISTGANENANLTKPDIWENDIVELERSFAGMLIPQEVVKLNSYSTITDVSKFIDSHFANVKANKRKQAFLPYMNRLKELNQYLSSN